VRGRRPIPADLRQLIAEMATANRTWGEERIAAELLVKLGIRVSPRTVRRYMPSRPTAAPDERLAGVEHVRAESRAVHAGV
jgi:putative transposase